MHFDLLAQVLWFLTQCQGLTTGGLGDGEAMGHRQPQTVISARLAPLRPISADVEPSPAVKSMTNGDAPESVVPPRLTASSSSTMSSFY